MEAFYEQSRLLMDALVARAEEAVPGCSLVSVQFEPLDVLNDGDAETEVRLLKSSQRNCFVQGTLLLSGVEVLKARAIFRKK